MKKCIIGTFVIIGVLFCLSFSAYAADQNKNILPVLSILFNPSSDTKTPDCNGDLSGTAYVDNCNRCVGGNTGETACTQDCHEIWGGLSIVDGCGKCVNEEQGEIPCEMECSWGKDEVVSSGIQLSKTCSGHTYSVIYKRIYSNDIGGGQTFKFTESNSDASQPYVWQHMLLHRTGYTDQTKNYFMKHITRSPYHQHDIDRIIYSASIFPGFIRYFVSHEWSINGSWDSSHSETIVSDYQTAYDMVLSIETIQNINEASCHLWWDHYDKNGNWLECLE